MEKRYQPADIETRLYQAWETSNAFSPSDDGKAYCIMLPPPNVTGTLHMGHAFQVALMDCLVRYRRMRGDKVLWQAGTDHAGIATQMLIERKLAKEGISRSDIGREQFVEHVWEWKKHSGDSITKQLRRLGASLDWSRECFTMDEGLSQAVQHAFITLYNEGLIFRGKRLVNWDPVLKTAVSDLEVVTKEEEGYLWHIRYPLLDSSEYVTVATTRPETLFGDTAVAVHPDDTRYQNFIGASVVLPVSGRHIPVIADQQVDPEFGSGCVKVTPAHDFNDYQIGIRHQLQAINIFNKDASLNEQVPDGYHGLDRYAARDKLLAQLHELQLLEREEKHLHSVPYGDRSHSAIEPFLTDQWFVKTKPLAAPAIKAVESGAIRFYPDNWSKIYLDWMNRIEDWCISRQIWWGHRIPAWYDEKGNVYVGESEAQIRKEHHLSSEQTLKQDEDVLDTWFSSALWPFSTLGWPEKSEAFQTFYPTSVLVTGFDIIFFWAARMIMMGLKFTGEVPFKAIYIHGLVRDAEGQKMSKSKGNVLDPIDLIDGITAEDLVEKQTDSLMQPQMEQQIRKMTQKHFPEGIKDYGTDALRFTFIAMASTGRDIKFDVNRIEGYRNFCNKLWNAARFTHLLCQEPPRSDMPSQLVCDQWIQTRLDQLIEAVDQHIAVYRFDLLAHQIYQFVWHDFCDWHIEFIKLIQGGDYTLDEKQANLNVLVNTLETILRLLHPITPYISENIWQALKPLSGCQEEWLQQRTWAASDPSMRNAKALQAIEKLQSFVNAVRRIRSEAGIAPQTPVPLLLKQWNQDDKALFETHHEMIIKLAHIKRIEWLTDNQPEPLSATAIVGKTKVLIPTADLIDINAEHKRLSKETDRIKSLLEKLKAQVSDQDFLNKAPSAVVEKKRQQVSDFEDKLNKYNEQLKVLQKAQAGTP